MTVQRMKVFEVLYNNRVLANLVCENRNIGFKALSAKISMNE